MIYVRCRLLDGVEEIHRKPETVLSQIVQIVGIDVYLFLGNERVTFLYISRNPIHTMEIQSKRW